MIWSQLKKQVRSLMCEHLCDRVDFHKAVYRNSREGTSDRAWITIDGQEVFEVSSARWVKALGHAESSVALRKPDADPQMHRGLVDAVVEDAGSENTGLLGYSLHRYLEAPIAESLQSTNPVIRALAMLDRRTGKRTLARISVSTDEHPLVKQFFELRTAAHGSVSPLTCGPQS
jgi:hypothetical protein